MKLVPETTYDFKRYMFGMEDGNEAMPNQAEAVWG